MAEKITARTALTSIAQGTVTPDIQEWALAEIAKMNAKNEKRKADGGIKAENKPIADAILATLANGGMLALDLTEVLKPLNLTEAPLTVNKVNGVALEMVKLGMLVKSKVKVKGKGEMAHYALAPTEDTATEGGGDAEDTAPTEG